MRSKPAIPFLILFRDSGSRALFRRGWTIVALALLLWIFWREGAAAASGKETAGKPASEGLAVVVAMRYLQIEGVSHSHLYLFARDGKLVRQLRASDSGQDADPMFSPDGKSVLYTRITGGSAGSVKEWRLVSLDGKSDRAVAEPPLWREAQGKPAPVFDYGKPAAGTGISFPCDRAGDVVFRLQDGVGVLTLKDDASQRESGNQEWFPKLNWFRGKPDEPEVNVAKFPVFRPKRAQNVKEFWAGPLPSGVVPSEPIPEDASEEPEVVPETVLFQQESPFIEEKTMSVAIFAQHIGSTDGTRLMAADLRHRKLYDLAPNGGAVAVLKGVPAFTCVCSQRYLPLGDGRLVNCSYLDLWEPETGGLRQIRFAQAKVGVFYGASLRTSGKDGISVFTIPGFQD